MQEELISSFWDTEEKVNMFSRYTLNCSLAEILYQPISFEEVGFSNIFPPNCWINAMGRNSTSKCYQIMRITWLQSSVFENPELVTCTKADIYRYICVLVISTVSRNINTLWRNMKDSQRSIVVVLLNTMKWKIFYHCI